MLESGPTTGDALAEQARHAEALGFDLATVHPDHPSASGPRGAAPSLEAWTAITWIASATRRIRVAPTVMSLPYRHAGVLAKMAESLDRLSGGRLVLPLGAGGDDQAIAAFGLGAGSPGGKVRLLDEALTVVRELWDGAVITRDGRFFHLDHASINPPAERRIPIWIGGYGDAVLDLVARRADGWIPSHFVLPPSDAVDRLGRIRRTAEAGGRDPDDLEYAYNVRVRIGGQASAAHGYLGGPPEEVAEWLRSFVATGFTLLNLWPIGDQIEQRERLARDVVPLVLRP
jgi:alkanesulfonate monooxygenase SsuD/methylene tetrahydromethanopterin reductase-like flavin-dependent oxidoreductase (luciferase family)